MTEQERAELARLAEAATPGPWLQSAHDDNDYPTYDLVCDFLQQEDMYLVAEDMRAEDALFAAAARQAVPALLAENAALRAGIEYAMDQFGGECDCAYQGSQCQWCKLKAIVEGA